MKRIGLTGGTGYIGSALVPAILKSGYKVNVLSRQNNAPHKEQPKNLSTIIGDIRDEEAVKKVFFDCDYVIHLAGVSDGANAQIEKAINQGSFLHVMQKAAEAKVKRFLFISTSALYGMGGEGPCDEDSATMPLTGYAQHKLACEEMLQTQCPKEMEYVILRPGAVCGYAPHMRLDLLVHLMARDAITKGKITVCGSGNYRPHIHMKDMVSTMITLLDAPTVNREIFNAASENLTLEELAKKVQAIIGNQVSINILPTEDKRSYRISSNKIMRSINFQPTLGVDTAINDIKDMLADGTIADPYDPAYYPSKRIMNG